MINIIITKLKDQYKTVLYYAVGLIGYAWMLIGLFPTIKNAGFEELMNKYPKDLLKFFGTSDPLAMTKIEGFLSLEFLYLFFILIISFFIGSSAGATITGSIEKKTMDFQLSQPISRTKLLISETIASLINTFLLVVATSLSILLLTKIYNVSISLSGLIAFSVVATAFLWAIYGIAIICSSMLKSKITAAGTTVSIVMAFYIFTSMTSIIEKIAEYDKYSLFYLYEPQKLLQTGTINWGHLAILLSISIIGILSATVIFNKKDV